MTGSATDAPEVSTQEVTLDQSVGQEDQEPSARETQAEIEESTAPAKGKAKKKPAPAKKQKRKKDEDDDDEFESDEGVFATKKVAPRSGHSKRRKTENADRGGVKFCSRCLRRYIPKESEAICHACSSIQGGRKSGIGKKRGKVIINEDGVRVAVMSLKDLCIKVLAYPSMLWTSCLLKCLALG